MSLGEGVPFEHLDDRVRQVEQPQQVAHGDAAASHAATHLRARQAELLHERGASSCLLDRVEVLAGHVLDQGDFKRGRIAPLAHERRERLQAGELGRAPPSLAGNQLISTSGDGAHEHWLQHALLAKRSREAIETVLLELTPGLLGVRRDQLKR